MLLLPGRVMLGIERVLRTIAAGCLMAVMLDAGKKASRNVCEFLDGSAVSNRTRIEAAGVKLFKLNDADLKKLAEASSSARKEWAAQLDRRSLPGSEVLEAYLNALEP